MKLLESEHINAFSSALTDSRILPREGGIYSSPLNIRPNVIYIEVMRNGRVNIGCCEGIMREHERLAFNDLSKKLSYHFRNISRESIEWVRVPCMKFIKEKQFQGMPPGVLSARGEAWIMYHRTDNVIFPSYRSFSLDFDKSRRITVVSPRNLMKDTITIRHPVYTAEIYTGVVSIIEVSIQEILEYTKSHFGLGSIISQSQDTVSCIYVLGDEDLSSILKTFSLSTANEAF